jgi:hypothetical protein
MPAKAIFMGIYALTRRAAADTINNDIPQKKMLCMFVSVYNYSKMLQIEKSTVRLPGSHVIVFTSRRVQKKKLDRYAN